MTHSPTPPGRRARRGAVAAAVVALGIGAVAVSSASAGGKNDNGSGKADNGNVLVDLQLLAFNDYHGHVEATAAAGTIDGQAAGGGAYLAAKLNELREGHANSITVAAGDLIGGSPFFSGLFHDEPSVESLNAMNLVVSSVGNHEFDEGVDELLRMQNGGCHPVDGCYFEDEPYAGADFQWLAANVKDGQGSTPLPPYWITKVDGIKVGFIGMTLEATPTLVAAAGIQGWDFLDEAATANALVPVLRDQGVRAIVVLLHEGGTPNPVEIDGCKGLSGEIVDINAALDPQIDVLITGHTHLPYNCVLENRMVTSAYSYGRVVSEFNLVLDKRTRDVRRDLSTAENHAVLRNQLTPDPAVTEVIEKWAPLAADANNTVVGAVTADIVRGGNPPGNDRGVESSIGNLVADAQRWATSSAGADVAFMNPGGLRADLVYGDDGSVTFGEAFDVQPFGNTLFTFDMTGDQIARMLRQQCQTSTSRPILHLGVSQGFTYDAVYEMTEQIVKTLDPTAPGGIKETLVRRCVGVTISNVMIDGSPLDPAAIYQVTANNFLADGGDNFTVFREATGPRADGGNDLIAFVNYLGTFAPVTPPGTDRVNETFNVTVLPPTGP